LESAVEIGCALLDLENRAARAQLAQRIDDEPRDDHAEDRGQREPCTDHELGIERAPRAEIDGHHRDHEGRDGEHRRAAGHAQGFEAAAKCLEIGLELSLNAHAAIPLRTLRCQFATRDSMSNAAISTPSSQGPSGTATSSPLSAAITAASSASNPRACHRCNVPSSTRVKSDSRGSTFTATTSVRPPPITS